MARYALPSFLLLASLASVSVSCKKKQVEEVKKEILKTKEILEVPLPEGAVGELVIKDPESFAARVSKGAGLEPMVGASPWQKLLESVSDENAKKALKAIDPHGTVAAVGLYKIGSNEKPHGVFAARLKDPEIASAALEAAAKTGGQIKAWDSKVLETKVYEPGDAGQVAVYGDVVLVADTREALEGAGKYAAWRSSKSKVDHELIARIPMERVGPELKRLANEQYAKLKPGDIPPKVKAEVDPLVAPVTNSLTEMGEAYLYVDIDGDNLKLDESIATKGSLSAYLAKVPSGDATPLLSMPKSESVAMYRFGDGLGPLIYALMDWGIDGSPLSTADRAEASKEVRVLGKSIGHVVTYSTDSGKGAGAPSVNAEVFVRVDLDDAAGAKGAIGALHKLLDKGMGPKKPTATAYKKLGAEGETVVTPAMIPSMGATAATSTKDTWTWAIKGPQLFVDLCLGCAPLQLDAAFDPAAKMTLADDPVAKAKIAEMPTTKVVSASYGTSLSLPGTFGGMGAMLGGGAPPPGAKKPTAPMWGYSQVNENAIVAKGVVPMMLVGDLAKTLLNIGMMGSMGGGMGGAPPF